MSQSYKSRPIPILEASAHSTSARALIPIDFSDPRAGERLVDVRGLGVPGENFYARSDGLNAPYNTPIEGSITALFLRESAATKLAAAHATLKSMGLGLFVLDAYRPIETQFGLWRHFWTAFEREQPGLPTEEVERKTLTFVSDPRAFNASDPNSLPPLHSTGGAVDVTLVNAAGEALDMGTPFDDATNAAASAFYERGLIGGAIDATDTRLLNRRILYWAMRDAGFTNYLNEWWHYDFGNQMHALTLRLIGEPLPSGKAWYGYVDITRTK